MKKKIRVLVVEDHPVARAGIRGALEGCERLEVVAEAGSGEEALLLARKLLPDVMVMDIELPGMDGLDVTEIMRKELPDIRVILLSMHENAGYVARATHSGACGYLLKDTPLEKLVESVLAAGGAVGGGEGIGLVAGAALAGGIGAVRLTKRDERVLALIAAGKSNKEIAAEMGVEERTAESYRVTLKRKLNIRTTAGLTKYAIGRGLIAKPIEGEAME